MATKRLIGIDFGTSTTVMRVKNYDENDHWIGERKDTKAVTFDNGASMVPTLVRLGKDGQRWFGFEAQLSKKETELYREFKIHLEDPDLQQRAQAREMMQLFFGHLYSIYNAQRQSGHFGDIDAQETTIVSYPVKWSEETRALMVETARDAGFPNVHGMDEAEAAIHSILVLCDTQINEVLKSSENANVLLIDMGAGTTDLVLCRCTTERDKPMRSEILSTWPRDGEILFGGGEVDKLLEKYISDLLEPASRDIVLSNLLSKNQFKTWKEMYVSPALASRKAVKEFSEMEELCDLRGVDPPEINLDRSGFETILTDYLKGFPALIFGCLKDGGVQPEDVDIVVLTGGHSNWYFVGDILLGKNALVESVNLRKIQEEPNRIVRTALPQETVAIGLVMNDSMLSIDDTVPPPPPPADDFMFFIDDVFTITGRGTVVTGVIQSGTIKVDDPLQITNASGKTLFTAVSGIEYHGRLINIAERGDDVGLLLKDVQPTAVRKGQVIRKRNSDDAPVTTGGDFEFRVEAVSTIVGHGQLAAGIVRSGTVRPGDRVKVRRSTNPDIPVTAVVEYIDVQGQHVSFANTGTNAALMLSGVSGPILKPQTISAGRGAESLAIRVDAMSIDEVWSALKAMNNPFCLERIPDRQVNAFLAAAKVRQQSLGDIGRMIFYYDDTFFGSGKNGFLITSKFAFARNLMESLKWIRITNDSRMLFDPQRPSELFITDGKEHLQLPYAASSTEDSIEKKLLVTRAFNALISDAQKRELLTSFAQNISTVAEIISRS